MIVVGTKLDRAGAREAAFPPPGAELACRVSSHSGEGVEALLDAIGERLPESPPLYPEDDVSDRSLRFLAAELVREAATDALEQELPYALAVEIEQFDESRADLVRIRANLIVERASQKKIAIGEGGRRDQADRDPRAARDREARGRAGAPRAVGEGRAALDEAAGAHQGTRVRLSPACPRPASASTR